MVKETIFNFSDAPYETPEITVIEVEIEKGFATSLGGTLPEGDAEPAGYYEW